MYAGQINNVMLMPLSFGADYLFSSKGSKMGPNKPSSSPNHRPK
jgi:hypothetical protein